MLKLSIGRRILLLFLATALLPLLGINVYWLASEQNALRKSAAGQLDLLATAAAHQTDQYLTDLVNSLIIHSQTASVQQFDLAYAQQELDALMKQNGNLLRVSLVDAKGNEKIAFNKDGPIKALTNVSQTDAFRLVNFLSGSEYLGPVVFDASNTPRMQVAVPLVTFSESQYVSNLSTAESGLIRAAGDIKGALIVDVDLRNLWQTVLSTKLGRDGYAYAVDDKGNLIAYPNSDYIIKHPQLAQVAEVHRFLTAGEHAGSPEQTTSETGAAVLSSYHIVSKTNWAIVAEEPISSIYADANRVIILAIIIFLVAAIIAVTLALVFSRQITKPIGQLAAGAAQLGQGNLNSSITLQRDDEFGLLAATFNSMAVNLRRLFANLQAESTKLNAVLNNIVEGVLALDDRGNIVVANSAASQLNNRRPLALVGQPFSTAFAWRRDDQPLVIGLDFTGPTKLFSGLTFMAADGQKHYIDLLAIKIIGDPSGIGTIIAIYDETKKRELELMKIDFVSLAAHELRTPLTAIRGYFELIKKDRQSKLTATTKQYLEQAGSSANELSGLINNLLNVSRIERGALTMAVEKINWTEVVIDTVKNFQPVAKDKKLALTYAGPTGDLPVLADKLSMREVLNNLIANAIHYSSQGQITVTIQVKPDQIITSVKDTGVGIPAEALPHLFTKFYRVHSGMESGSGGTGLGLYIAKSIVEMHSGKIWVESQTGSGSTFSFSLPPFDEVLYQQLLSQQPKLLGRTNDRIKKNSAN